jgi:putative resolvase
MKLSDWAKRNGVTYHTAYRWFRQGNLPVAAQQTTTGTILVETADDSRKDQTVIYGRVSSHPQRQDLARQVLRCREFCAANGWSVAATYQEVGSGMNDQRRQLHKMLALQPTRIVVEHKDRLTRFGFHYLRALLEQQGCQIAVMDNSFEAKDDLMKDLLSVIYSFAARMYGLRKGAIKARKIKGELQ